MDRKKNSIGKKDGAEQENISLQEQEENSAESAQEPEASVRDMMDDVEVPDSLEPQAVERMLEKRKEEKRKKYRWKYAGIAAAACLCAAVGITAAVRHGINSENSSGDNAVSKEDAGAQKEREETGMIATAKNYDEIYEYISAGKEETAKDIGLYGKATLESEADTGSASSFSADYAAGGAQENGAYSDTNVREEGVGEADIIKTDGKNLYILNGQSVEIVDITSDQMEERGQISMEDDFYIAELYVEQDRLMVLYSRTEYDDGQTGYDGYYKQYTCADVYNVSDPSKPEKLGTLSQSGTYNTVRVKDGYVYLFSSFYADGAAPRANTGAYIPEVQGKILEASAVYMPEQKAGSQYTVISAFSLNDPSEKTDGKAVFGNAGLCYVSGDNIYISESYYGIENQEVTQTSIRKVSYKDGKLEGTAQTKVDGTLRDSFCIDEYNGYLRLVTTVSPADREANPTQILELSDTEDVNTTSLYVLDAQLETVGKIENLAPEEEVYSARFMGDAGYFVTFKQVDPLFSVDLSDPAAPEIIGELKIPGFSEYLHPYGENRLLGVGMEVDEEGVSTEGVKLSMFDISDAADVQEISKYVIENTYSTDIAYNYKAAFVDVEKNLFGFTVHGDTTEYCIFSYDEDTGFTEVFSKNMAFYGSAVRGIYAGDRFYLIAGNTVEAYTLSGFEKIDDIVL